MKGTLSFNEEGLSLDVIINDVGDPINGKSDVHLLEEDRISFANMNYRTQSGQEITLSTPLGLYLEIRHKSRQQSDVKVNSIPNTVKLKKCFTLEDLKDLFGIRIMLNEEVYKQLINKGFLTYKPNYCSPINLKLQYVHS
jgi:hypothetical protein